VKLVLLLVSFVMSLALVEAGARLLIHPSTTSYGKLLGRELPPKRVVPPPDPPVPRPDEGRRETTAPPVDSAAAADAPEAEPEAADFQGVFREDPLLGYAPAERTRSPHGWWIANDIGARSIADTTPDVPAGRRRLLVVGESYGCGSRVRQEEAWPTVVETEAPGVQVVNLAVDGYSMAQALLRFRRVTETVDYDAVVLVFVPNEDLWRDVNTVRTLVHHSWRSYTPMPRFEVDAGRLTLVRSPYATADAVYADNADGLGNRLREHLRAHDRFYVPVLHEAVPVVGRLVLWKLATVAYAEQRKGLLLRSLKVRHLDVDGEAVRVVRAIFAAMRDDAATRGKTFLLAVLPDPHELGRMRKDARRMKEWNAMLAVMCDGVRCVDVAGPLRSAAQAEIDRGYDGTHYGPRTNRLIAGVIASALPR